MEPLSTLVLFAIGLGLIALEAMMMVFFVIWIGFGFLITSGINYFHPLESFWYQVGIASIIAVILFAIFYKSLKRLMNKAEEIKDDFIEQGGTATIKNGMVAYQGTYFTPMNMDISDMNEHKVQVIKVDKNNIWIEKLSK